MEYISRETLLKKLFPYDVVDKSGYAINAKSLFNAICELEKADVVEVVRCKDCRYSEHCTNWCGREYLSCELVDFETVEVDPDHFCGYGERKKK